MENNRYCNTNKKQPNSILSSVGQSMIGNNQSILSSLNKSKNSKFNLNNIQKKFLFENINNNTKRDKEESKQGPIKINENLGINYNNSKNNDKGLQEIINMNPDLNEIIISIYNEEKLLGGKEINDNINNNLRNSRRNNFIDKEKDQKSQRKLGNSVSNLSRRNSENSDNSNLRSQSEQKKSIKDSIITNSELTKNDIPDFLKEYYNPREEKGIGESNFSNVKQTNNGIPDNLDENLNKRLRNSCDSLFVNYDGNQNNIRNDTLLKDINKELNKNNFNGISKIYKMDINNNSENKKGTDVMPNKNNIVNYNFINHENNNNTTNTKGTEDKLNENNISKFNYPNNENNNTDINRTDVLLDKNNISKFNYSNNENNNNRTNMNNINLINNNQRIDIYSKNDTELKLKQNYVLLEKKGNIIPNQRLNQNSNNVNNITIDNFK